MPSLERLITELPGSELIGTVEVAPRLKVTLKVSAEETRDWASRGILPFQRVSGRLVFRLGDVLRRRIDALDPLKAGPELPAHVLTGQAEIESCNVAAC